MARRMEWERASARDRVTSRTLAPVPSALVYWLTIFSGGEVCSDCSAGPYEVLAYRHTDQHMLCQLCWERLGVEPKKSKRYKARHETKVAEKTSQRKQNRRNATRADARKLPCVKCGAGAGEACWGKNWQTRRKRVHLERLQEAQNASR